MKIIGVFLLIISSSIADDLCEDIWDGDCEGGACGNHEVVAGIGLPLCPGVERCCAHVCKQKWNGECRAAAGGCGGDIKVFQPFAVPALCPGVPGAEICCVDEDDTQCDKQMDGECSGNCVVNLGPNYLKIGKTSFTDDCLCPLTKSCCVKKNDHCKDVKGGKCRTFGDCLKRGGKRTFPQFCNAPGEVCCVPNPPCERKPIPWDKTSPPMGICIETKHCPEGYETAEERGIQKPPRVSQWCYDDDELCCVPDK